MGVTSLSVIPTLSMLLFFHPLKRNIPGLATLILWEGKLPSEARENAFNAILELAKTRKGVTQMTAIESLAYLAHGMNIRNLMLHPRDVEGLLKIKLQAFHALQEVYKTLPCLSLNKLRTAVKLWEIGYSPSWRVSIVEPIVKAVLGALYGYSLFGLAQVLYDYFTCSAKYLEKFSWVGGLKPYASDYSKECFDAQVKVFNTLPGQPASTLVGNSTNNLLSKYHFPNNLYDLDLSNKGINGSVIAEIVEGFKQANITLNSLNITNNMITNSSHMVRILVALPAEIKKIDMVNLALPSISCLEPSSFLGLKNLKSLQSLNISQNNLCTSNDVLELGPVLQNLFQLQELRLSSSNFNLASVPQALKSSLRVLDLSGTSLNFDQVAFGNALAQNLTLHELYLGNMGIGQDAEGNRALAQGLAKQSRLSILDLSSNSLGKYANVSVSTLLESLPPSLTALDISCPSRMTICHNDINKASDINALAKAIQCMPKLSSFNAAGRSDGVGNALGNSPGFLNTLQGKQNLSNLFLRWNSFKNSTQLKDLLQTIPNLKHLDFSNNQLTNGAILAPVLSKLNKLILLNLGCNGFSTEDRIAIWNATSSFLAKSPFYLNEDLSFTSAYLKSFPASTKSLNFAGRFTSDAPTNLQAIMPQVVRLFPNLEDLDLSDIALGMGENEGIEALISFLPKLGSLYSLKIAGLEGDIFTPYPYFQNLSYILGQLPGLRSLDLSNPYSNNLFFADSLGQGLKNSHSLTSINLAGCWGQVPDVSHWEGGVQLIQGLREHSNLTVFDLSDNSMANYGPNGTFALADSLKFWPRLQFLNLAYNYMGQTDPQGTSCFLKELGALATTISKQGRTLEVNLPYGIANIEWTQGAKVLQNLTENTIIEACARQLCTGKALNATATRDFAKEKRTGPEMEAHALEKEHHIQPTSMASAAVPFYQPLADVLNPWLSWSAWSGFFDQGLDRLANGILHYSQQVAENAPGYFPGKLDNSKPLGEEVNKKFYNYPVPHFHLADQRKSSHMQLTNHTQSLSYTNSQPPALPTGGQPLGLPN